MSIVNKHIIINNGTYPDVIHVFINTSYDSIKSKITKYYKKTNPNWEYPELSLTERTHNSSELGYFQEFLDEGLDLFILYLSKWENKQEDHDTLSHECHHAVQTLLAEYRCMSTEREALAYQHDYLVKKIGRAHV
jgi:uncharacterized protein YjaZ